MTKKEQMQWSNKVLESSNTYAKKLVLSALDEIEDVNSYASGESETLGEMHVFCKPVDRKITELRKRYES
jgi:hypothetical protein